jgi:hypothetical protein
MKASELIQQLVAKIAEHGDLPVTAQDGMDPSDDSLVQEVEFHQGYLWTDGEGGKPDQKYFSIRA